MKIESIETFTDEFVCFVRVTALDGSTPISVPLADLPGRGFFRVVVAIASTTSIGICGETGITPMSVFPGMNPALEPVVARKAGVRWICIRSNPKTGLNYRASIRSFATRLHNSNPFPIAMLWMLSTPIWNGRFIAKVGLPIFILVQVVVI